MGFIGKIQDTEGNTHLLTSTMFGTCDSASSASMKEVTMLDTSFNVSKYVEGMTIHVYFANECGIHDGYVTLAFNGEANGNIIENPDWPSGSVVSFTLVGESGSIRRWYQNGNAIPYDPSTRTVKVNKVQNRTSNGALTLSGTQGTLTLDKNATLNATGGTITIDSNKAGSSGGNIVIDSAGSTTVTANSIYATATGNLEITATNGALKLKGNYNTFPSGTGTSVTINTSTGLIQKNTSSRRYKDNINYELDTNDYHNQIMDLKPCTFEYKNQPNELQLGLIAEDVELVNPNIPLYDEEGRVDSIKDRDLITLLIIESQYKDQQIQSLQSEIELLKQRLDNLES